MTNEERRAALNRARVKALEHAENAEGGRMSDQVGPWNRARDLALIWAAVAEAMKDGDPVHDAPDGAPLDGVDLSRRDLAGSLLDAPPTWESS